MAADIDLSGQPHWKEVDRSIMPTVEPGLLGVRRAAVGWIGRLRDGVETYAPVADVKQGGILELSQAQARHLHAELGKLIEKWDSEPRDLVAEVDTVLRDAGHVGRNRASQGYEVETDGNDVHVYHNAGDGRVSYWDALEKYAQALTAAGYYDVTVQRETVNRAGRVVAIPPAAEDF